MLPHSTKLSRAESARINGAKSRGPKTPEGLFRSQTASLQHGLYAVRSYMLPDESTLEFAEFQAQMHAYWQPKGFHDQTLVEELVGVLWESKRLHAAKNDYVHDHIAVVAQNAPLLKDQAKLNLLAEIEVSVAGGKIERLNARLAHLARERSRLQRDLLTVKKHSCTSGGSQMALEINARQHPGIPATAAPKPVEGRVSELVYTVEVNLPSVPTFQPGTPAVTPNPTSGGPTECQLTSAVTNISPSSVPTNETAAMPNTGHSTTATPNPVSARPTEAAPMPSAANTTHSSVATSEPASAGANETAAMPNTGHSTTATPNPASARPTEVPPMPSAANTTHSSVATSEPASAGANETAAMRNTGHSTTATPNPESARPTEAPPKPAATATPWGQPVSALPSEPVPEQPQPIIEWAEEALGFQPDDFQTQVLAETANRIMILAPRQTGKSTVVAVRVLHEAMKQENALILIASASGRQSGQIMEKARQMARLLDLELSPPPAKCDGFTLANGAQIIALPDSEETIRGFSAPRLIVVDEAAFASESVFKALEPMLIVSSGTFILLSTPNGQSGFFYDQWHADPSPWKKLRGHIDQCPRVDKDALEKMRESLSKETYEQEFECKFVPSGGQVINIDIVRQCYTSEFDLFFPEYEKEGKW